MKMNEDEVEVKENWDRACHVEEESLITQDKK